MGTGATPAVSARQSFLPYTLPSIGEEEIREVAESLRSGWVSAGPKVRRFEQDFASYIGVEHAVAVTSCTAALQLSLAALGIGPGDEVIVPTMTFCATANVVVHLGAVPVLVDVDDDMLIDLDSAEAAINQRTKVLLPVHYAGQACDLDDIGHLARRRGLSVVEDAAHAAGASYRGARIGTHGDAVAFSFHSDGNLVTGEGGMVTTSDGHLAARLKTLAAHGIDHDAARGAQANSWFYDVSEPGYNARMTDLHAALGIHQLRRLDWLIERRREMALRYLDGLGDLVELELPRELPARRHAWHLYPVRLNLELLDCTRGEFIAELRAARIGAGVHFTPVHLHPYYQAALPDRRGMCPHAEWIYERIVSLPLYTRMSLDDLEDVIAAVRAIVTIHRRPLRDSR